MKYISVLLMIVLFSFNSGCVVLSKEAKKMNILKEQAIEIANQELLKQGFDVMQKDIAVDEHNTDWNKNYLSHERFTEDNPRICEKLNNRDYWAICYTPKEMGKMFGGGAWVFVDKNTGEILLLFYEK